MGSILIVDDEKDIVQLMSETLNQWGYHTITAQDGQEALEKFRQKPVDVVVTDLKLPGMDGVKLLEEIKQIDEETEVIVITGYPAVNSAVEAMKRGAHDYLIKPIDMSEFKLKLEQGLEKKDLKQSMSMLKGLNWALIISIPIWLVLGIYLIYLLK
ncbi:MAG: sigma-54-dependent Fis family transcriptional regulator [Calditrichaeota bacterium]|nr:MAG: sigma-54-dependent Fis family transcriptional regulator [Calditrichota bacterium]